MAIDKLATGIRGFDVLSEGGVPRGTSTLVIGMAGTGKTVFALQALSNAVRAGERAALVSFEESAEALMRNTDSFAWAPRGLVDDGLQLIDGRANVRAVATGDFQLDGLLAILGELCDRHGVRLVAFDGIDQLLDLLDDPIRRQQEVLKLCDFLSSSGITGLLSAKVEASEVWSRGAYGFMLYLVDCVVHLQRQTQAGIMMRGLEILKYRGTSYRGGSYPVLLDETGIEVAPGVGELAHAEVPRERVPTGVADLDRLLDGGHWRASATLISGAPGTCKTTLSAAFAGAAAARGEQALFVALDERIEQIARNTESLGLDLERHLDSGMLAGLDLTGRGGDPAAQYVRIERAIEQLSPSVLVIDPISALGKTSGEADTHVFAERTIRLAKARGITCVVTSLLDHGADPGEVTRSAVSTIADTWIALSYHVNRGERNRALSIVKSRGTPHSSQVRELLVGGERGLALADVFEMSGDVLMGTARLAYEDQLAAQEERARRDFDSQRRKVDEETSAIRARLQELQAQLDRAEAEREAADEAEAHRREQIRQQRARIAANRRRAEEGPDDAGPGKPT